MVDLPLCLVSQMESCKLVASLYLTGDNYSKPAETKKAPEPAPVAPGIALYLFFVRRLICK